MVVGVALQQMIAVSGSKSIGEGIMKQNPDNKDMSDDDEPNRTRESTQDWEDDDEE